MSELPTQNLFETDFHLQRPYEEGVDATDSIAVNPVILIGLMGATGSGKSHFARMASGDQKIIVSRRLGSCTKTVEASDTFEVGGHLVRLVDTPGFNDDELTDAQVLLMIADWMKKTFDENQKLHGIMYLQRINDTRIDSGAVRCLQLFRDICGPHFLQNTILLTTMWDKGKDATLFVENEDNEVELQTVYWKSLMQSGAMYHRSYNKQEDCNEIIDLIVQKQPKMAKLQEEVGSKGLGVGDTGAGKNLLRILSEEIAKLSKTFQEKIKLLEESQANETAGLNKQVADLKKRLKKCESDMGLLTPKVRDKDKIPKKESLWSRMGRGVARGLGKLLGWRVVLKDRCLKTQYPVDSAVER